MDEYNMSHTGAELDEAISKFKDGYIKPSGTLEISENGVKNVKEYESVSVDVQGADVSDVTATADDVLKGVKFVNSLGQTLEGSIPIKSIEPGVDDYIPLPEQDYFDLPKGYYPNDLKIYAHLQEKTVTPRLLMNTFVEPDSGYALSRVIVNGYTIPDSYIHKDSTKLFVTQSAEGTYTAGASNTYLDDVSINIGFKPKIFIFLVDQGMKSKSTSDFLITSSILIADNNNNILAKRTTGTYYNSSLGARTAQSTGDSNTFYLTSNGVHGGSGSSFFIEAGFRMKWYAWG